jgi:hypothetical protein
MNLIQNGQKNNKIISIFLFPKSVKNTLKSANYGNFKGYITAYGIL